MAEPLSTITAVPAAESPWVRQETTVDSNNYEQVHCVLRHPAGVAGPIGVPSISSPNPRITITGLRSENIAAAVPVTVSLELGVPSYRRYFGEVATAAASI